MSVVKYLANCNLISTKSKRETAPIFFYISSKLTWQWVEVLLRADDDALRGIVTQG